MSEASAKELAVMLDVTAYMAYKLTLGSVPPWMAAVGRRLSSPIEGDMVAEISTYHRSRTFDLSRSVGRAHSYAPEMRIGKLLRVAREPVEIEDWDEREDGPKPTETVFYILGLDGVEHRWTNATFIAIPQADWQDSIKPDEEEVRRFQLRA